jgi:predicted SnoaL-like aldol condensation-catalyzing enzyme
MSVEANKSIVSRYIEMWNTGNVILADEVLASTYVDHVHPEILGPEHVKKSLLKFRTAYPDFHITVNAIISESDLVALRGTIHRTHEGNEAVSLVIWFVRIENGKMAELWTGTESSG